MAKSFFSEHIALFGQPVAENPTIVMQEAGFAELGLPFRYLNIEVPPDRLRAAVQGMRAMNFAGANCILPHKVHVPRMLDTLTEAARTIGAVNTIVRQPDGSLLGENTDGKGFLRSVQETGLEVRGANVVLLGAGGAARAIAVELALAGVRHITLVNRSRPNLSALRMALVNRTSVHVRASLWEEPVVLDRDTQLVVNATSIGLYPDTEAEVPIRYQSLRPSMLVCDVIPNPPDTIFLRKAREAGAATLDGLGMLVYQGAIAFKLWTGEEAPIATMRRALEEVFTL